MPTAGPKGRLARELPPPLELLCLRALWSLQEASVKGVQQAVTPSRTLAYTTIMTLLDRLAQKGLVSRRKVGRAFLYAPQTSRDALRRIALREFLDSYFDGSVADLQDFLLGRPADGAETLPAEIIASRLDTALL